MDERAFDDEITEVIEDVDALMRKQYEDHIRTESIVAMTSGIHFNGCWLLWSECTCNKDP